MPSLFPMDHLFQQAESDPKLMDELKKLNMLSYWFAEYYRPISTIERHYPNIMNSWLDLKIQMNIARVACAYSEEMESSILETSGEDLMVALSTQRMAFNAITTMMVELSQEAERRQLIEL